jgi:hypothetical protein
MYRVKLVAGDAPAQKLSMKNAHLTLRTVNTCKHGGQLRAVQFSIDQRKEWKRRPSLVSQRIGITPNAGWIGQAGNMAQVLG